jgi:hypothetical protein
LAAPSANDIVMMICPNLKCRKVLRVPAQYRGHHVKCHYCQLTFEVPAARKQKTLSASETEKP